MPNTDDSLHWRENNMYRTLSEGYIPSSCNLDHLGIKVVNNKIVTPNVKLLFNKNDKRHAKVIYCYDIVGRIFFKEDCGYIRFYVYNKHQEVKYGSF